MKVKKTLKKGLSIVLTGAMLISGLAVSGVNNAKAEETSDEYTNRYMDISYYSATKRFCPDSVYGDTFGLDGSANTKVAKVYLGKDASGSPLQWYIAGHDEDGHSGSHSLDEIDNLVLFSTKSIGTSKFNVSSDIRVQVDGYKYDNSLLMRSLDSYCYGGTNSLFSKTEDSLLDSFVIGSGDSGTGYTGVKLYAPNVAEVTRDECKEILVGAKDNIKVSSDYFKEQAIAGRFWLRKGIETEWNGVKNSLAAGIYQDYFSKLILAGNSNVDNKSHIVPAATISLRNVANMSVMPALTAGAYSNSENAANKFGDTMTIRLEGQDNISSRAFRMTDSNSIKVVKRDQDKDLYLCVQGENRKSSDDSVSLEFGYSVKIDGTQTIDMQTIKDAVGSNIDIDLERCKIWLEKPTEDGSMVYAVNAEQAAADKEIKSVDVTCKLPVKGESFSNRAYKYSTVTDITTGIYKSSDKYPLRMKYYLGAEEAKGIVSAGNKYTSKITVAPLSDEDYWFSMDISAKDVTVNGNPATTVTRNSDGSLTITYDTIFTTNLKSVAAATPGAISNVVNGTEKTAEALGLPKTVSITTAEDAQAEEVQMDAGVVWDLENLAEGTYDPAVKTEQRFKVNGKVSLPEVVVNPDNIPLDVSVDVTVAEKQTEIVSKAAITVNNPTAGAELNMAVKATEGINASKAAITVKGSDTAASGNAKYNTTYVANITLSAEEYYKFADDISKDDITVNGNPVTSFVKNEDGTITITYEFEPTRKANLVSITAPEAITVPNGAEKTVEGLKLPASVTIKTEDAEVTSASVTWNLDGIISYNPAITIAQKFAVSGNITLPESISNESNVSLKVKANVTVSAKSTELQKITSVDITEVSAPQSGESIVNKVTCQTTGVSKATVIFVNKSTNNTVVTKGKYNTVYIANITLTAASGYQFASDISKDNVKVLGNTATSVTKNSNGTLLVKYELPATRKAKLTGITKPASISNVANGTAKTAEALGLPKTVTIKTEDSSVTSASVIWNLETLASGTYDASVKTAQTFTVNGTVALPDTISNDDNVSLTVTIQVSVNAGKDSGNNSGNNNNSGSDNNAGNNNNSGNNSNTGNNNNSGSNSNTGNNNNSGSNSNIGNNNNSGSNSNTGNNNNSGNDSNTGNNNSSGNNSNTGDNNNSGNDSNSGDNSSDNNGGNSSWDDNGDDTGDDDSKETPDEGERLTDTKTKSVYIYKSGSLVYAGTTDKNAKTVTVRTSARIDGVTYKVTSIADGALSKNKKMTKVIIGTNVKTIGKNAFNGCVKLASVTIGKNVTSIGDKAFYNCTALKNVAIPAKVTKIGKSAFEKCKSLKKITISTQKLKKNSVGVNAFKGTPKNAAVKVPAKSLKAYNKFLYQKGLNKKVKITK